MKIALVPQVVVNASHPAASVPYVPLGLLSLAAAVDRTVHQVQIVDLTMAVRDGRIPYDGDFEAASARLLRSGGYDLVGFSTFSSTVHHTLKTVRALKALPSPPIAVLGGPQATSCHREILESFPVDCVVRGEGEETFPELIQALEEGRPLAGVRGLAYRDGATVARTGDRPLVRDLDTLPVPAFDLYPLRRHPKAAVEWTRGCPYHCVYCATSAYWGRDVRHKSIERVLAEMAILEERHDVECISFADDTFTLDRARALEFCGRLVEAGIRTRWICSTRIDRVDPELLRAMAEAGCCNVFYGIESGSERVQAQIRKGIRIDRVIQNLRSSAEAGIGITASFMMGFPEETEEDLAATLRLRCEIQRLFPEKQAIQLHVLSPDVDTEITLKYADRLKYDGFHSDHVGVDLAPFDRDLILRHRTLFLAYYYIEPLHLDREFVKLVHGFVTCVQVVAYWSTLFVMLRDGDPLGIARRWIEHLRTGEGHVDVPLPTRVAASVTEFLKTFFRTDRRMPEPIRELFLHEYEMARLKGGLVADFGIRERAGRDGSLAARRYEYDPRETIGWIRKDHRKVATQRRRPTRIDYRPRRRTGA